MRSLLPLLVAPAFALGLVVGADRFVGPPTLAAAQPTGLVWADRVFTSRQDLAHWLQARGSSYEGWAARHPGVANTFSPASLRSLAGTSAERADNRHASPNGAPWWTLFLLATLVFGIGATAAARTVTTALLSATALFRRAWQASPRPARVGVDAVELTGAAAAAGRPLRRRTRRYLPRIAFYSASVACAFAIGAAVATYLN
jgi:hypothetical protein